ncbi:unnamed protein product [Malus baccata var. baccata]|uniref:RING-type domain-containing protein n=1 Tax=Malus baccata TaxID=106549 RepID=A0A540LKP5_MALBA|nr:hypothetical protein C1H46_027428 [Malus baccata]
MGLQSQLNDVSSDSIPLLLIVLIAGSIYRLGSSLLTLLHFLGLSPHPGPGTDYDEGYIAGPTVGSGLAGLVNLSDQLAINRQLSYPYDRDDAIATARDCDCVVCLCTFRDGEQVRMLQCRHVFHKHCFDSWLNNLNFNCPLCRSPVLHRDSGALTRCRLSRDPLHWLSIR